MSFTEKIQVYYYNIIQLNNEVYLDSSLDLVTVIYSKFSSGYYLPFKSRVWLFLLN